MAALVIAWPANQMPNRKLRKRISRELHKDVYSEIVVVVFDGDGIPVKDIFKLDLWDVCTRGRKVCFEQTAGCVWKDPMCRVTSEDVYICGRNLEKHVLGICLGLQGAHEIKVLGNLCLSQSKALKSRALCVVGSSIGFANVIDSRELIVSKV